MPRKDVIRTSLTDRGALIKVRDMEEACEIANMIAAEHLEISARSRSSGPTRSATPVPCSWGASRPNRWATTAPAQPRAADLAHRALLVAAGRV
jgi:hypothetical protein